MKRFSKPIIAVLATLISSILACLVFAVWIIAAPQKELALTRDFVVSFDFGSCNDTPYGGESDIKDYPAKSYPASSEPELAFGAEEGQIADPAWQGYTFKGWKTGEAETLYGSTAVDGAEQSYSGSVTADVTFTAQWQLPAVETKYTVAFESGVEDENVTGIPAQQENVAVGTTVTLGSPSRTGYTFEGWKIKDYAESNTYTGSLQLTADLLEKITVGADNTITLTAQWSAIGYTITFDTNGHGTKPADIEGVTLDAPTVDLSDAEYTLTETGYDFDRWETKDRTAIESNSFELTVEMIEQADEGNIITLTAQWTLHNYQLVYSTSHGSASSTTVTITSGTVTLPTLTATGYSLQGWTYSGQSTPVKSITVNAYFISSHFESSDTLTLTAVWYDEFKVHYYGIDNWGNDIGIYAWYYVSSSQTDTNKREPFGAWGTKKMDRPQSGSVWFDYTFDVPQDRVGDLHIQFYEYDASNNKTQAKTMSSSAKEKWFVGTNTVDNSWLVVTNEFTTEPDVVTIKFTNGWYDWGSTLHTVKFYPWLYNSASSTTNLLDSFPGTKIVDGITGYAGVTTENLVWKCTVSGKVYTVTILLKHGEYSKLRVIFSSTQMENGTNYVIQTQDVKITSKNASFASTGTWMGTSGTNKTFAISNASGCAAV